MRSLLLFSPNDNFSSWLPRQVFRRASAPGGARRVFCSLNERRWLTIEENSGARYGLKPQRAILDGLLDQLGLRFRRTGEGCGAPPSPTLNKIYLLHTSHSGLGTCLPRSHPVACLALTMSPILLTWSKANLRAAAKRIYDDFDKGNLRDQNAYYVDFKEILAAQDADLKQAIAGLLSDFSEQTDFTKTFLSRMSYDYQLVMVVYGRCTRRSARSALAPSRTITPARNRLVGHSRLSCRCHSACTSGPTSSCTSRSAGLRWRYLSR